MGRLVLIEGLDLAGKSTLVDGLYRRLRSENWEVRVCHGDLCSENPVAAVTRQMMRWDEGFSAAEGAPLFLASHLWDQRNFRRLPDERSVHLQDSCALRSLAFEKVVGDPFFVQKLNEVVKELPNFDAAYVLTTSLKSRKERLAQREGNDLHDHFMLSDPVRFSRIDSELLRLSAARFGAKLISTDEWSKEELLEYVWQDLKSKFERAEVMPSAV